MVQRLPSGKDEELSRFLRPLISSFVADVGYRGPCKVTERYWAALHKNAAETGIPHPEGSTSYKCLVLGGHYSFVCFPKHPLDVQVHIGIYTWFAILIDNLTSKDLPDIERFYEHFANGKPQPTPLLECFAEKLRGMFKYWDPVPASGIVSSSISFVNGCAMEIRFDMENMTPTKGGLKYSWYLRERSGIGEAFSFFVFPKAKYPDISCFIEAIPDLSVYTCLCNDILSFYKEEKAGETNNYIHITAGYREKDAWAVLKDTVSELEGVVARMRMVVKGKQPYEQAVEDYIVGSIDFHLQGDRYKLREIGVKETGEVD